MTLEQQVCSLDLAKRLKELGVKQESLFLWCNFGKDDWRGPYSNIDGISIRLPETPGPYSFTKDDCWEWCSAFTVAELGEMLPTLVDGCRIITQHGLMGKRWFVTLENMTTHEEVYKAEEKTEADARSKMLIYLMKEGKMTL